ncbi:MAG: hypothetical protein AB7F40_07900 [Victivallaceae bacterium]|nr:hypothetical protein [Victivallaceae bacterium]
MKRLLTFVLPALLMLAAGCATEPITEAELTAGRVRSEQVTPQMVAQAAAGAATKMRKSKPFAAYLEAFRATGHLNPPLLMIGRITNDTTTVLHTEALTERIATSLSEDGDMVQVTTAVAGAGQHRDEANAQVRDLENDDNFDASTVQKRGTLRAPDLALTGSIIRQKVVEGRKTEVVYTFVIKLTDLATGKAVYSGIDEFGRFEEKQLFGL